MINQKLDHRVVILRVMVMSGTNRNVRSRVCLRLPVAAYEISCAGCNLRDSGRTMR